MGGADKSNEVDRRFNSQLHFLGETPTLTAPAPDAWLYVVTTSRDAVQVTHVTFINPNDQEQTSP